MKDYKERRAAKQEAEKAKREEGWSSTVVTVGRAYPRAKIAAHAARWGDCLLSHRRSWSCSYASLV
jgi:hypothetical protein